MFANLLRRINRRWREPALPLFAVTAATLLLVQQGAVFGDGLSVYETTRSIVHDADLAVDRAYGVRGSDGEYYSKYGVGLSVISLIPYVIALPFSRVLGRGDLIEQAAVASVMPIASALLVAALYLLARRLGGSQRSSVAVAACTILGTFLFPYTKEFFGEPVAALFVVVAIERALAGRSGWAGTALAAGALIRPPVAVLAPILLAVMVRQRGWSTLRYALPPLALGAVATFAVNMIRFGSPTATGYSGFDLTDPGSQGTTERAGGSSEAFSTPVLKGLETLLLDPTKSILIFAPVITLLPFALIALWRRGQGAAVLLLVGNLVAGSLLVAAWAYPGGGFCWGPRLLIPAVVPALAALAVWLDGARRRAWTFAAVVMVGLGISAPAVAVSSTAQWIDSSRDDSPTVSRQYELVGPAAQYSVENIGDRGTNDYRRYLSVWQVGLMRELGWGGLLIAVPLSALLLTAGVVSAFALRRALRRSEVTRLPTEKATATGEPPRGLSAPGDFARLD